MSKFHDSVKATGRVIATLIGPDGKVKERRDVSNLVVTTGKNWIAGNMLDAGDPDIMSHMAVGTGATAPVVGDTTLQAELARVALSSTANVANATTFTASFGPGTGTGALTEAGIFNAGAAGTMLARVTFAAINKPAADTLTIEWSVSIN